MIGLVEEAFSTGPVGSRLASFSPRVSVGALVPYNPSELMTSRRRGALSLLIVLVLAATNLAIYSWGSARKASAVNEQRRAVTARLLQASVERDLEERGREVALLTELAGTTPASALSLARAEELKARLDAISAKTRELSRLAVPESRPLVEAFSSAYTTVRDSWVRAFDSLTAPQRAAEARALEDAARAAGAGRPIEVDPVALPTPVALPVLSSADAAQKIRRLQDREQELVERATAEVFRVTTLVDRLSLTVLLASALVAAGMAFALARKRD
jgi:hypothetical protein